MTLDRNDYENLIALCELGDFLNKQKIADGIACRCRNALAFPNDYIRIHLSQQDKEFLTEFLKEDIEEDTKETIKRAIAGQIYYF